MLLNPMTAGREAELSPTLKQFLAQVPLNPHIRANPYSMPGFNAI